MKKSAFTLVELIVVITILAILGTIGFVSILGYGKQAKNSKIISDIRSLSTAIEFSAGIGTLQLSDVVASSLPQYSIADGTRTFGSSVFSGGMVLQNSQNYHVGTLNFSNLRQNGEDFFFTNTKGQELDYLVASAIGGEENYYQIAGSVESGDGQVQVLLKGNYFQDIGIHDAESLFSKSGTTIPVLNKEILSVEHYNPLKGSQTIVVSTPTNPGAVAPFTNKEFTSGNLSISLPASNAYNTFSVNSSVNNSNIYIEIGDKNTTINTAYGNDTIIAGNGSSIISTINGNDNITLGNGNNEIHNGYGTLTLTAGNGNNTIQKDGGNAVIQVGGGDNVFQLGYGNNVQITSGDGNNSITANGPLTLNLGNGNNSIQVNGYGNHIVHLGTGNTIFRASGGDSIIDTGISGNLDMRFGGNNSQRLNWNGGNVIIQDYWRWGGNRISFTHIGDLNSCSDINTHLVMSGSTATITSTQGTLEIHFQDGQTNLNCASNFIF